MGSTCRFQGRKPDYEKGPRSTYFTAALSLAEGLGPLGDAQRSAWYVFTLTCAQTEASGRWFITPLKPVGKRLALTGRGCGRFYHINMVVGGKHFAFLRIAV